MDPTRIERVIRRLRPTGRPARPGLLTARPSRADLAPAPLPPLVIGLSWAVVGMATASSLAGLRPGVYQDEPSLVAVLRGYDVVALSLGVPLLAGALPRRLRRSARAQLVGMGGLAFVAYDMAYYVFGATRSAVTPLHTALLTTSATALAAALATADVQGLAASFPPDAPTRPVAVVLLGLGLSLGAMWSVLLLRSATGSAALAEPSRLVVPPHLTRVGAALDLSVLVPGYLLAGAHLWRRSAWGYVLAPVLLVSGTVHQVSYMTALRSQVRARVPGAVPSDPAEPVIAGAFAVAAAALLRACGRRRGAPAAR